jgi:hypothetical protein
MNASDVAARQDLADRLDRLQQGTAWTRPVMAGAILLAVVSLFAATYLMIRSLEQTRQLEAAQKALEASLRTQEELTNQLAKASRALESGESSPAAQQKARETIQTVTRLIPAASGGEFALPTELPVPRVQLLTLGAATGWDVDVFWCAGDGAADNYSTGRAAAMTLAGVAASSKPIAPGVRVGRVQLRPIRPQDSAVWRGASGAGRLLVVTDSGPGEKEAAEAVMARLGGRSSADVIDQSALPGRQAPSKWYLSVIACQAFSAPS